MANLDEKQIFTLVISYYNEEKNRAKVIETLLEALWDDVEGEKKLLKAKTTVSELVSEASYVLLELMPETKEQGNAENFQAKFLARLRQELRKFTVTKNFVDIGEVTISDPNPNPEEAYALKEQLNLAKDFLSKNYSPVHVEWFIRRYANNDKFTVIADDYDVTKQAVSKTVQAMRVKVEAYMKEINAY